MAIVTEKMNKMRTKNWPLDFQVEVTSNWDNKGLTGVAEIKSWLGSF